MHATVKAALDYINLLEEEEKKLAQEVIRLRVLLKKYGLDPDRCEAFSKGEQCALKHGHSGNCKWGGGD